jgi:hypothetical protein
MENYASPYWKIIDRSYRQDEQDAMERFANEQSPRKRMDPTDRIARDMGFINIGGRWFLFPEEDIEF